MYSNPSLDITTHKISFDDKDVEWYERIKDVTRGAITFSWPWHLIWKVMIDPPELKTTRSTDREWTLLWEHLPWSPARRKLAHPLELERMIYPSVQHPVFLRHRHRCCCHVLQCHSIMCRIEVLWRCTACRGIALTDSQLNLTPVQKYHPTSSSNVGWAHSILSNTEFCNVQKKIWHVSNVKCTHTTRTTQGRHFNFFLGGGTGLLKNWKNSTLYVVIWRYS